MAILTEGTWPCKILSASTGADYRNLFAVQINCELIEGPDKGKRVTYEQSVDAKSAKYVGPSCKAIGWQGITLDSLADDVAKWISKTGGVSTVDIKHFDLKKPEAIAKAEARGEPAKFAKANAIGRGAKPLTAASVESKSDADAALRSFMGAGGTPEAGHADDDEIPFTVSSMSADVSAISRVLRGAL